MITIIVLMILAGVAISALVGNGGIISRAKKAADNYNQAAQKEANEINKLLDNNEKDNKTYKMHPPKVQDTGLTPVYWDGSKWIKLNESSSQEDWEKWYHYENKEWANAQSADGSMWVWIPRYEYKINDDKSISVNFVQIGDTTTEGYILHPAFSNDIENGGWSKEIEGFWVGKYAAGYQNGTAGEAKKTVEYSNLKYTETGGYTSNFLEKTLTKDTTKISYPVFKANTYAYNIISVGDAFLLSKEIKNGSMYGLRNIDSHLEKNSEWGAVAYLTQSKYGVNGNNSNMNEVEINNKNLNNGIYVNDDSTTGTKANIYAITGYGSNNIPNDITASSTKNMTGVFDLNGCVWETTAAFLKGGANSTPNWHNAMANATTSESSKYITLYTDNNKKGDAINETTGWNSDYAIFPTTENPIFSRGGHYNNNIYAGVFAVANPIGNPNNCHGFRVCLVV